MSVRECCAMSDDDLFLIRSTFEGRLGCHTVKILNDANSLPLNDSYTKDWGSSRERWVFAKGSVGGSVDAKKDPGQGTVTVSGEGHVNVKNDEGDTKVSVQAEASVKTDSEGNTSTSGGVKISVEKEF